ncbi:hypothetical protein GFS31_27150 [Leptolyngbya sp. BL0902]|uniref:hypothetical protein n=1 Tax=Leptolyngbya sp. BL0902 TaxID=1115757 RepID=UPI0018E72FDE|nr:hypothetical protein [Leptolyngbya sp. BL0902]QQE66020.1 hypothetical protein GFS31_27150 [Leptolyngbya sp. BL0902]
MQSFWKSLSGLSTVALVASGGAVGGLLTMTTPALANPTPLAQTVPMEGITPIQPGNISSTSLSMAGARQQMAEAEAAIANQDLETAAVRLQSSRETLNELSSYYQELAQMFVGINSQLNRSHREQALEAAQMRDQATYQLALVYRAQNQPDRAVPLLMEVLRSQQPTRDLGQRAYQQLFELGFVNEPFAGRPAAQEIP